MTTLEIKSIACWMSRTNGNPCGTSYGTTSKNLTSICLISVRRTIYSFSLNTRIKLVVWTSLTTSFSRVLVIKETNGLDSFLFYQVPLVVVNLIFTPLWQRRCWHNNHDGHDDCIFKVFQGEEDMHPVERHHTKLRSWYLWPVEKVTSQHFVTITLLPLLSHCSL